MQHLVGVDGVIIDLVREITGGVLKMVKPFEEKMLMKLGEVQIEAEGVTSRILIIFSYGLNQMLII